jgi:hypothetical protein
VGIDGRGRFQGSWWAFGRISEGENREELDMDFWEVLGHHGWSIVVFLL